MINCNKVIRESLQRTKRPQRPPHTASINLRPHDSYADALYLPIRDAVKRKCDNSSMSKKKTFNRSVRLDKSPSRRLDKENFLYDLRQKADYKYKLASDHRIETDRLSAVENSGKSLKPIRLKTDYNELAVNDSSIMRANQVGSEQTELLSQKRVGVLRGQAVNEKRVNLERRQLVALLRVVRELQRESCLLEAERRFCSSSKGCLGNSVARALNS